MRHLERLSLPFLEGREKKKLVGVVSAFYLISLVVTLGAGPVALSVITELSLGAALQQVVLVVGAGYFLGMALLLR